MIPESLRNVGIKCSFLNEYRTVETWEYQGNGFSNVDRWVRTKIHSKDSLVYDNIPEKIKDAIKNFSFYIPKETILTHSNFRLIGIGLYNTGRYIAQVQANDSTGLATSFNVVIFESVGPENLHGIKEIEFYSETFAAYIAVDLDAIKEKITLDIPIKPYELEDSLIFQKHNTTNKIKNIESKIVDVENEIEKINERLNSEDYIIETYSKENLKTGYYNCTGSKIPVSPYESDAYGCLEVKVNPAETITIKTFGGNNGRSYALTDTDRNILIVAEPSENTINSPAVLTVEKEGYLIVNCRTAYQDDFSVEIKKQEKDIAGDVENIKTDVERIKKEAIFYDDGKTILDVENPCKYLISNMSLASSILKWGFIGDSFGAGEFEYLEDGIVKYQDNQESYSFGARFIRMNNVDGYVFAQGGQTAKGWCTGTGSRTWEEAKKAERLQQAYIIQLGTNDANRGVAVGSTETDINLSDYNNNADTFAGWYAGIIQRLLSVQPRAIIFAATLRRKGDSTGRNTQMSEVIRKIVNMFENVFLVDIEKYGIDWESEFGKSLLNGGHPTSAGHLYQAIYYNTYIDWIIRNNMDAFKEVHFIGTDYSRK